MVNHLIAGLVTGGDARIGKAAITRFSQGQHRVTDKYLCFICQWQRQLCRGETGAINQRVAVVEIGVGLSCHLQHRDLLGRQLARRPSNGIALRGVVAAGIHQRQSGG